MIVTNGLVEKKKINRLADNKNNRQLQSLNSLLNCVFAPFFQKIAQLQVKAANKKKHLLIINAALVSFP